ncbi:hypothetical protein LL972_06495 [Xanthomonas campestris pv. asclepiadis]|uniref:hypothetical protein n=1 Tax=Xanthomonas campestris TaxID=339 RepID=UPI001E4A6F97|nr:hypothetical protein [Xanthomonas campestris]MCC4615664.1 hypothetical protein [Xanthomonas campestris pv. asclepiadis]
MDVIAFALIGAAGVVFSIGAARLVGWILDRRDAAILRQLREEDLIAAANHHVRIARIKRSVRAAAEREVDHA